MPSQRNARECVRPESARGRDMVTLSPMFTLEAESVGCVAGAMVFKLIDALAVMLL